MDGLRRVLGLGHSKPTYAAVGSTDPATTSFTTLSDSSGGAVAAPYAGSLKLGWWAQLSLPAKGGIVGATLTILILGLGLGLGLRKSTPSPPGPVPPSSVCDWTLYRLPTNAVPLSYAVLWTPTATASAFVPPFAFTGSSIIDLRIAADSPCILVHAAGLAVSAVTAQGVSAAGAAEGTPVAAKFTSDDANERIVVAMPFTPAVGSTVRLAFAYSAPLSSNNVGLYQSKYTDDSGATVTALVTQFEATAARRAFPCLDEPGYKATFVLTVDGVPSTYTALGNMPIASDVVRGDGARTVTFAVTPRMSTYLLAFACAPLVYARVLGVGSGAIPVTAYAVARGNNSLLVGYAAQAAAAIIPFYEDLYGVPFPLPKMDMVACPDFAAGAMENWGLITYRETAMLANTSTSSLSELQRVVVVVAHELAHQWFGDSTTMGWWDALWLNEGFASRMEFLGTDHFAPALGYGQQFQISDVIRALKADAFADVQVLTQSVVSSAEIEGQFSAISYSKGASLIYMVQRFLDVVSPGAFFGGVSAYLKAHTFANAEPLALWTALAAVSGVSDLLAWCQSYELHPGFAVVTVAWQDPASESTGEGILTISQQRFFLSPSSASIAASNGLSDLLFWVPLELRGGNPGAADSPIPAAAALARATNGFTGQQWSGTIGTAASPFNVVRDLYVKVGVNDTLYARVNYPPSIWAALGNAALLSASGGAGGLSPADRGALLDDIFAFAYSTAYRGSDGKGITTATALNFAKAWVPAERSYEALVVFISNVGTLTSFLVPDVPFCVTADPTTPAVPPVGCTGDPNVDPFAATPGAEACFAAENSWVLARLSGAIAELGWNASEFEAPLTTQLRASVLSAASFYGDAATITTAAAQWTTFVATGVPLDPNLASVITNSVVRWGGDAEWYRVQGLYLAASNAADKRRYLLALAATRNRSLLKLALDFAFTSDVRVGDKVSLITSVASSPWGRDLAWAAGKANWLTLSSLYGSGGFDISGLVGGLAGQFQTQAYADDVKAFFGPGGKQTKTIAGAVHDYNAAVESVARAVLWRSVEASGACAALG